MLIDNDFEGIFSIHNGYALRLTVPISSEGTLEKMARVLQALLATKIVLIFVILSVLFTTRYDFSFTHSPIEASYASSSDDPYVYQSEFSKGELGVLNTSYWLAGPQLVSGSFSIENGMLKIVSNDRYQVGFGMYWKSPTYENDDWEPWLPLYWKYHSELTIVQQNGTAFPFLIVENWIAWENGEGLTAMVLYQQGTLSYSYGGFPNEGGYFIPLDQFTVPSVFNVTISADYKAMSMEIDWSGHTYNVPMQIERIGTIPKPFTHFQITLMEPGVIYVKNLEVILS